MMDVQEPEKITNAWKYWYEKGGQVDIWGYGEIFFEPPCLKAHIEPTNEVFTIYIDDGRFEYPPLFAESLDEALLIVARKHDLIYDSFLDFFNAKRLPRFKEGNFKLTEEEREFLLWKLNEVLSSAVYLPY